MDATPGIKQSYKHTQLSLMFAHILKINIKGYVIQYYKCFVFLLFKHELNYMYF